MRRLAFVLALGGLAAAQGEIKPFPKVDPYTKNDPGLIEKAGYVSLGPFRFGDDHTSEQVQNTLGGIPLIWVETAHFKLGSALPECALSDDKRERERLKGELQRLQAKLPDVKTKPKKLDPWLRLHLFAQRLEELYADFQGQFGLKDLDFPTAPPDPGKKQTGPYMGEGPYLGMPSKFTVLIFDKKSSLGRYSTVYFGREVNVPQRHYFQKTGSLLFATAFEFLEGDYVSDSALACDVLNGVLQNMANGYKGYATLLPLWYSEGLSHWFRRRFDPRYHLFSGTDLTKIRTKDEEDWAPSVRARVEHEVFPKSSDMLAWTDPDALEWADQLMLWSRVDYLLAREDGAAKRLLDLLKEPLPAQGGKLEERMLERSRSAFREATGQDPDEFDRAWCAWVEATYPRK
jgi:hypothetical protein